MAGKKIYLMIVFVFFYMIFGSKIMYSIPSAESIFKDEKVLEFIKYVKSGNEEKINELIKNGVDIDFKNENGVTPLYYFFWINDYEGFKKLLELGATPNVDPEGTGFNNLINATMDIKDDRFFKELLNYNVDINYLYKDGKYPVLKFALYDSVDIKYLKMLLEHGINPYYSEYWTDNPILSALTAREYRKVILLLDYYPDYLKDERKFKLYKREATIKEIFIEDLENYSQAPHSKLLKDQQELVKYLKDKFGIDVKLKYPNGRRF